MIRSAMPRIFPNLSTFLMPLVFLTAGALVAATGDEAAVLKANQALMTSLIQQNRQEIAAFLHEKLLYSHSDTRLENMEEVVNANVPSPKNNKYQVLAFEGTPTVVVVGGTALVRGDVKVNLDRADGTKSALNLNILHVWLKSPKAKHGWLLVGRQATRKPVQP